MLERKSYLLNLVLINICGPLLKVFSGARYFLKIINNYIRKV
jgi:hypothetical protein